MLCGCRGTCVTPTTSRSSSPPTSAPMAMVTTALRSVVACRSMAVAEREHQTAAHALICAAGRRVDAVVHFAGRKAVGESVEFPMRYYTHNVVGAVNLIEAMRKHGVRNVRSRLRAACCLRTERHREP